MKSQTTTPKNTIKENTRPPIVVVMGHIDHGKTKILDWYRKTKVAESEAGGITQHIGAYEVEHKGKKITFIDTPGHESFSKMRSRGANVADLAILVVAADEGVKPQTKEAIEIIRENKIPFMVAINKIDKPEANPEKVKQELAKEEVLVESYGGKVPSVEISAKTGQNMDELLEIILLSAEMEDLKSQPEKPAEGVVIEAHLDSRRGITSTLLVRDGTLKRQEILVIGRSAETIKILEDFLGRPIEKAEPSTPVRVAGLSDTPMVGDLFQGFETKSAAEEFIQALPSEEAKPSLGIKTADDTGRPIFNIILKTDVVGSREVLEDSLKKLESDSIGINIIRSEVGDINESDAKLAQATKLVTIVGFKVKIDSAAQEVARTTSMHIITGEIIYELLDEVKKQIAEMIPPEIKRVNLGIAKVLKIFKKDGAKQIVGGRVEDGKIKNGAQVEIRRVKTIVGQGKINQLQSGKQNVDEVEKGSEFGALIDSSTAIQESDLFDIFSEEIIKHTL